VGAFLSTNLSVSTLQTAEDMFSDDNTTIEKSPEATALIESPKKITSAQTTTSFTTVVTPLVVRNKGGRPKGTTQASKMNLETAIVAAKNEIVLKYLEMMKKKDGNKVRSGCLKNLINEIKTERNLPDHFTVTLKYVHQRIRRGHTMLDGSRGPKSPLDVLENVAVGLIVKMARIRMNLTPTLGLALINSLIMGTKYIDTLNRFKSNLGLEANGKVGPGYWRGFVKRNKENITTKRGKKYELNRDSWTTYRNFYDMYSFSEENLVDCGLAKKLDNPVWMDCAGNIVDEKDACGCKVTIDITHPEMIVVADEVGGNTNMKGDGHVGGQKYLCEKGCEVQQKVTTTEKHFTLLGFTALTGEPVMCVVIFAGKVSVPSIETGIDLFAEMEGNEMDADFFEKNSEGYKKMYPGGPSCFFKGKNVPCLTKWSDSGGITSEIL